MERNYVLVRKSLGTRVVMTIGLMLLLKASRLLGMPQEVIKKEHLQSGVGVTQQINVGKNDQIETVIQDVDIIYSTTTRMITKDNKIYLPLNEMIENFGCKIIWNKDNNSFAIIDGDNVVYHKLGTNIVTKNSKEYSLKYDTINEFGETYVTLEFLNVISDVTTFGKGYNISFRKTKTTIPDYLTNLDLITHLPNFKLEEIFNYIEYKKNHPHESYAEIIKEFNKLQYGNKKLVDFQTYTLDEANEKIKNFGRFLMPGMPSAEYNEAMRRSWKRIEFSSYGKPRNKDLLLDGFYNYKDIENFIFDIANNESIPTKLYDIGTTQEGRTIYNIEIGSGDKVLMLFGGVHTNETYGVKATMKMVLDLILEAENDDFIKELFKNCKIVYIPLLCPDGYEVVHNNSVLAATYKNNGNYVDVNRNAPETGGGQLKSGAVAGTRATSPANRYYGGPYLGSSAEIKAIMKWGMYYITEEKASMSFQIHQQGRIIYGDPLWDTKINRDLNMQIRKELQKLMGSAHGLVEDTVLDGRGGYITDMLTCFSLGFEFGRYGVFGPLIDGEAQPLLYWKDIKNYENILTKMVPSFVPICIEATATTNYLFNHAYEYSKYNYDKIMLFLIEKNLGKDRFEMIRQEVLDKTKDEETIIDVIVDDSLVLSLAKK